MALLNKIDEIPPKCPKYFPQTLISNKVLHLTEHFYYKKLKFYQALKSTMNGRYTKNVYSYGQNCDLSRIIKVKN